MAEPFEFSGEMHVSFGDFDGEATATMKQAKPVVASHPDLVRAEPASPDGDVILEIKPQIENLKIADQNMDCDKENVNFDIPSYSTRKGKDSPKTDIVGLYGQASFCPSIQCVDPMCEGEDQFQHFDLNFANQVNCSLKSLKTYILSKKSNSYIGSFLTPSPSNSRDYPGAEDQTRPTTRPDTSVTWCEQKPPNNYRISHIGYSSESELSSLNSTPSHTPVLWEGTSCPKILIYRNTNCNHNGDSDTDTSSSDPPPSGSPVHGDYNQKHQENLGQSLSLTASLMHTNSEYLANSYTSPHDTAFNNTPLYSVKLQGQELEGADQPTVTWKMVVGVAPPLPGLNPNL